MEQLSKRLLMFTARFADLYGLNGLMWWALDQITVRGWEGFDTFITLDIDFPERNQ